MITFYNMTYEELYNLTYEELYTMEIGRPPIYTPWHSKTISGTGNSENRIGNWIIQDIGSEAT